MRNHNNDTLKTSDTVLRKIYLSLYLKGLCVRGSCRPNRNATYWPPLLWPSALCLSCSPGLLNRRPGGPALCWVLAFSTASCFQIRWISCATELYNSLTPIQYLPITGHRNMHFRRLWNGMVDRHRAEITVMQFTAHSLPVHQFVTVPWDFNPVPYFQPSSPTSMEDALPPSLEWHVWPGRRSIYNTRGKFIRAHRNRIRANVVQFHLLGVVTKVLDRNFVVCEFEL